MQIKQILKYSLILWVGVIWYISSLPGDALPTIDALHFDKLAHTSVYLIMSILLFINYNKGQFHKLSRYDVLILAVIMASLDESHQFFIKFRAVSALDLSANLFGIFLGYFLVKSFDKKNDRIQ